MTCNQSFAGNSNFKQNVIALLKKKLFNDPNGVLDSYYNQIGSNTAQPPVVTNVQISNSFSLRQPFDNFQSCPIIGHDIPLWFDNARDFLKTYPKTDKLDNNIIAILKAKNFKTVMLVSQDPLRRNAENGYIQLSSPWGLHGANYKGKPTELIRFIIYALLQAEKNVYITDYSKLYVEGANTPKKSIDLFASNKNASFHNGMFDILQEEWRLLNQEKNNTIVILLGKSNSKIIADLDKIINPLSLNIWNHPASCRFGKVDFNYYKNELINLKP